ncbi:hypothetical protein [Streptomyces sp. NBC_00234]|uniref:hypothetical protein n=1 Tax=Streptomyces sp. NBC_00234 TaxID=2903638 RepID=UPI003FA75157
MARRSTDLLPQLLCLAAAEIRHAARGTGGTLDREAERDLLHALAALGPPARDRGTPGPPTPASPPSPSPVSRARMEG